MTKKVRNIFLISIILLTLICLCINNIQLNRNIYCNDMHIKRFEEDKMNSSNNYDLDSMEKSLDYLERKSSGNEKADNDNSIDIMDKVYVPKFRILFSMNPIDIRLETQNYKICVNNGILITFQNKIQNIDKACTSYANEIGSNINNLQNSICSFKNEFNEDFQYELKHLKLK